MVWHSEYDQFFFDEQKFVLPIFFLKKMIFIAVFKNTVVYLRPQTDECIQREYRK